MNMRLEKLDELFAQWCASVKDAGYEVQPNSATARQRKLGWDAAIAIIQKHEALKAAGCKIVR